MGGIPASVLGFVLLYRSKGVKKTNESWENIGDEVVQISEQVLCQSENATNADIIIVEAGVAGSALAYTLGKDGRRVHVIERDLTLPDRIARELLQPGGYLKLIEWGLEDCVEEIDAEQVLGYALYKNGRSTKLSYPLQNFDQDVAGRRFRNGRFIQRMRERAASLPNVRLEEGNVTSLLEVEETIKGVQHKTKIGQELTTYDTPLTIVDIPSCFVALILENCELPYPNHGHVILVNPSPILFYRISGSKFRCLVDILGQKLPSISNGEMANYLKTVVAPQDDQELSYVFQIPQELRDAFDFAINKGNIRTMPNRSMPAAPYPTPGALLLGYI
ncbi:squalene monooxygenase SE1-like [Hevea brasiliensis]|uniref:squalene monooxygenase SE1-like n=1 Tax=Hevea brasiliensis TaxID=3981 RepID=UPI0025E5E512|nr:squalene monooxygenase SE1-like [Hevea brasiliensis]